MRGRGEEEGVKELKVVQRFSSSNLMVVNAICVRAGPIKTSSWRISCGYYHLWYVQVHVTYYQAWIIKRSIIYWYFLHLLPPPLSLPPLSSALPPPIFLSFLFELVCFLCIQPCRSDQDSTTGECEIVFRFLLSSSFSLPLSSIGILADFVTTLDAYELSH